LERAFEEKKMGRDEALAEADCAGFPCQLSALRTFPQRLRIYI